MSKINFQTLVLARENAGLSLKDAARKLNFKDTKNRTAVERLELIEQGKLIPSKAVLEKMAALYRRNLLLFYIETIPKPSPSLVDYRKIYHQTTKIEEFWLSTLIRDIQGRQIILREAMIDNEVAETIEFIESLHPPISIEKLSEEIKKIIGFNIKEFRRFRNTREAFQYLRELIERKGVYVLLVTDLGNHFTKIMPEVFRGFTLVDKIAPFIVINNNDARSALSFTLLHELVHLFLGQSSISNGNLKLEDEKICNDVASSILLNDGEVWDKFIQVSTTYPSQQLINDIENFSSARNISSTMVAYRLLILGIISSHEYEQLSSVFKERWIKTKIEQRNKQRSSVGGPDYNIIKRNQAGHGLVKSVKSYLSNGTLSLPDASKILGVSSRSVHTLIEVNS